LLPELSRLALAGGAFQQAASPVFELGFDAFGAEIIRAGGPNSKRRESSSMGPS
jgi:hypothetical protein